MTPDFKTFFNTGFTFHEYVAASTEHKGLWEGVHRLARIPEWARIGLPEGTARHLLVIAEDWCGDASNSVPVLARWAEEVPGLDLRIVRRDEHPDLMDRYLTNGTARSIPIVIALDEEYRELGHWGPRPTALQTWVMANRASIPKAELYPQARKWYARDHGETTIREVLATMRVEAPATS